MNQLMTLTSLLYEVDVDARRFPFSELVTGGRERLQCRPVQLRE
jgi:hypothetical protein